MKMQHQNVWDVTNVVLRGKLIAVNAYVKTEGRYQINDLKLQQIQWAIVNSLCS